MGERDAAQAAQLIRALCDVRNNMISQLNWLEKHYAQLDARALRRDINEAQAHITGLQRRYLGRTVRQAR
jgi:predicted metal-dependent hydrolase